MQIPENLSSSYQFVLSFWNRLGYEDQFNLWLFSGVLMLLVIFRIWYPLFRRSLGHQKFRGTWYTFSEYRVLIELLADDQTFGRRVMQHDEIQALRKWKYGKNSTLGLDQSKTGY